MNVVFISPHFPPQFFHFCVALRERGVNVLGLGDAPWHELQPELHASLGEYFRADIEDYTQAHRAIAYLIWRHGRIDRIDSHSEHWLGVEALLREDFNIPGPRPEEMQARRSKMGMADFFRRAEVPAPEIARVESPEQVRAFGLRHGYPLVFKPDFGVGAARTFQVRNEGEVDQAVREVSGYVVQPYVHGRITSYDGLVDREGRVLFDSSLVYSTGIMEVVNEQRELEYWTRRELPGELVQLGRRVVDAFGIRERFFHVEFFELPDKSFRVLEANIRPPGGFTTDMMNYSADVDVYRLWASMIAGERLDGFRFSRKYHVGYASRWWGRSYRRSHAELVKSLGDRLILHRPMPRAFAGAMGDEMYLIRDPDERAMHEAIAQIHES